MAKRDNRIRRGDQDFASTFTYFLWERKKGQQDQQQRIKILQAHSHTSCGKAKGDNEISMKGLHFASRVTHKLPKNITCKVMKCIHSFKTCKYTDLLKMTKGMIQ